MGNPYPASFTDDSGETRLAGQVSFTAASNQPGSNASVAYVTVQTMAPAGPFQTPLVFDSTASTGGLYAWDGSAYQQVGLATS